MFYLYIIKSQISGKFYIGHTNDLNRRINEHNSRQTKSTRAGKPWILVYTKEFLTNTEAGKEELRLKAMKSHKYIEELISSSGLAHPDGSEKLARLLLGGVVVSRRLVKFDPDKSGLSPRQINLPNSSEVCIFIAGILPYPAQIILTKH